MDDSTAVYDRGAVHNKTMVVDLRSDTLTKPCNEMRRAMAEVDVGDEVQNDDPTVIKLQEKVAELLKKEAAMFVPSGIFGNLVCIMAHCRGRGEEVICGDKCHIFVYEQAGAAHVAGVQLRVVPNQLDGTLALSDIEGAIRSGDENCPTTALLCLENTHNLCGGLVLTPEYMRTVASLAKGRGIPVHLDGARLLNAAVHLGVKPDVLTAGCDSVTICLSKGLGAPVGSVVASTKEFINRARRIRKILGGKMRQVAVLAAPGLVALDKGYRNLTHDHKNARLLKDGLETVTGGSKDVEFLHEVQTNILFMNVCTTARWTSHDLLELLASPEVEPTCLTLKASAPGPHAVRFVLHNGVEEDAVRMALEKFAGAFRAITQQSRSI